MKKEIFPVGYNVRYSDVIVCIIADIALLVFLFIGKLSFSEKDFNEVVKFVVLGIMITIPFLVISISKTLKGSKKRSEREERKQNADFCVNGDIQKIKEAWLDSKNNVSANPSIGGDSALNDKHCYYLKVSYTDPTDNIEKTALSEYYYVLEQQFPSCEIKVYGKKGSHFPLICIFK